MIYWSSLLLSFLTRYSKNKVNIIKLSIYNWRISKIFNSRRWTQLTDGQKSGALMFLGCQQAAKLSVILGVMWRTCDVIVTGGRVNTLRPRQNGRHFADDIFKRIFLNENIWIPIKSSLKFVPEGSINNIPALIHIMAWRRPGDKPLSEPMLIILLTHICVTRPQWVKANMTRGWKPVTI